MARIRGLWITLKSSLWFVPAISVLIAAGLALGLVEQDSQLHLNLARQWPSFFGLSADGSRSILATIAQSVITIAGVAFSITIVALSLAANQYTPRVLRNFMRDTGNQVVLGGLMGVFTYCVVVLRTIQGGETPFIPVLSVLFALLLALMAIGFFIYFIHHVATTIQAAAIISAIAQETGQVISSLLPEKAPPGTADCDLTAEEQRLLSQNNWHPVYSAESGYLQSVDSDGLVAFARKHGVTIKLQHAIGEFAIEGKPLVWIHPEKELDPAEVDELNALFFLKAYRTIEQDIAFGIRQIVDIAVKALSPGINDPTTALTCVHYLASILCRLVRRHIPPRCRYEGQVLCLVERGPDFETLVDLAFDQIRHHGSSQPTVVLSLLAALREIGTVPDRVRKRGDTLLKHADRILETAEQSITLPSDLAKIRAATKRCKSAIEHGIQSHTE